MRVHFERTGGIAGMKRAADLDTAQLPAARARELERLVEAAGFFALPPEVGRAGADSFQARIAVEDGARRHVVLLRGESVPPGIAALRDWLAEHAQPAPR